MPKVSKTISTVFNYKQSMYFLLLGHKNRDTKLIESNIRAELKSEMQGFRHFLHPFRLSIMQLLFSSPKTSARDIRETLEMSWSDFYSSTRQLEKLELVNIFEDFDETGTTRQFIIITEKGAKEYAHFIQIVEKFVGVANQDFPDKKRNDLYPRD